jgi:hypothetical protein
MMNPALIAVNLERVTRMAWVDEQNIAKAAMESRAG